MTQDEKQLLPCPWCGPKPGFEPELSHARDGQWYVICAWCGAEKCDKSEVDCVAEWNDRTYQGVDLDDLKKECNADPSVQWVGGYKSAINLAIDHIAAHYHLVRK